MMIYLKNIKSSQVVGQRRISIEFRYCSVAILFFSFLMFALCRTQDVTTIDSTEETPKPTSTTKHSVARKCNSDKEFHCQSEDKCIPIEWLCDFTEQCLDGEDEFGCSPEWCMFEHGMCNWKNVFKSRREGEDLIAWRKYHNSPEQKQQQQQSSKLSNSKAQTSKQTNLSSQTSYKDVVASSPLDVNELIQEKLNGLNSRTKPSTNFIFAPLIINSHQTLLSETNGNHNFNLNKTIRNTNLIRSASFRSPFISQTNSMCQLRFKYALWAKLIDNIREGSFKIILTLEVKLHEHPLMSAPSSSSFVSHDKTNGHERGRVKVIWSKSIESSSVSAPRSSNLSKATTSSTQESPSGIEENEWLVDVVELGHLKQIEIGFDVRLAIIPLADENRPQEKGKAREGERVEGGERENPILQSEHQQYKRQQIGEMITELNYQQQNQHQFQQEQEQQQQQHYWQRQHLKSLPHASIVALNWLKFQGCAWPQGKHENSVYLNLADRIDLMHTVAQANQAVRQGRLQFDKSNPTKNTPTNKGVEKDKTPRINFNHDIAANLNPVDCDVAGCNDKQQLSSASCRTSEFQCQNSICLEEHKLCNFVNDCMSEIGSSTQSEDEQRDLCQNVPGMEDFESSSLASSGLFQNHHSNEWERAIEMRTNDEINTEVTPANTTITTTKTAATTSSSIAKKLSKFWTLTSNWPVDKIRVQNSKTLSRSHLPRRDHTLRSSKGSYLSLELPRHINSFSELNKNSESRNIHWAYLRSAWMRKLNPERGQCRVKFFYNLVSDKLNIGTTLERGQYFKLYLAVEHFIGREVGENTREEDQSTRKIDRLIFSHVKDYESSSLIGRGSLIEYPGVDFWREVNYELVGLSEGDLFYVKIAIIVEILGEDGFKKHKTTINIDDLSTHFGCGFVEEDNIKHIISHCQAEQDNISLKLSDYATNTNDSSSKLLEYYNLVRKKRANSGTVEFEPHKLIIGVVIVLSSIAGLILIIVYIVVPYVERVVISYHDQLTAGLSGIGSTPGQSHENVANACELTTTDSDWEQISRRWRRTNFNDNIMTDNEITVLESSS